MANYEFTEFPIPATPIASVGDIASADGILVVKDGSVYKIPLSSFLTAVGAFPASSIGNYVTKSDFNAVMAEEKIYTGSTTAIALGDYQLSENVSNYEYLDVWCGYNGRNSIQRIPVRQSLSYSIRIPNIADSTSTLLYVSEISISFSGSTMSVTNVGAWQQGNGTTYNPTRSQSPAIYIEAVYGIKNAQV